MTTFSRPFSDRRRFSVANMAIIDECVIEKFNRFGCSARLTGKCPKCETPYFEGLPECACSVDPFTMAREYVNYHTHEPLTRAHRLRQYRRDRLTFDASLGDGGWFRTYNPQTESQLKALTVASGYTGTPWSLTLSGAPGVGKSHLVKSIARKVSRRECIPVFLTETIMEEEWRLAMDNRFVPYQSRDRDMPSPDDLVQWWSSTRWLFIDDLGLVAATRAAWLATVDRIIHAREASRLPTVLTTNLTGGEVADRYGVRVMDRLSGGLCLRVEGPSGRKYTW